MDVSVTHNGNNITSHVVQYEREHKICTGIGQLEMEVDNSYSGSFDPWDEIVITENGRRSGQYYVTSASKGQPNSTIAISAQDNSKRLSDYFISDSYSIDYPSYNRFWIEYFLDEAGIDFEFLVPDSGALLSNGTALGLMSLYEQIMMLVQLSGWYFTFDYNGTMLIGKSMNSFGNKRGSYSNDSIIEIKVNKSDRMLRNRVVVWGHGDPESERWVFADVRKPTKWDYDSRDKRTIVISNGNIRKTIDAFSLANKALLEFATISVEKQLVIAGAQNLVVGDIIGVRNKIFTGSGKVTTFGTSMSRTGLVTNVTLDERCPRLFGFFDIGGYVYVGTFGDGVWRKNILPRSWSGGSGLIGFASGLYTASGWQNYSSGLMDLNVTDLHVNAGVLASVTSNGSGYYSIEDETPWIPLDFQGQTVSMSGDLLLWQDGSTDVTVYSGLSARACIINRDTNNLRFAIDTRSGLNYGDFLMETDPLSPLYFEMFSYIMPSGLAGSGLTLASGVDPNSFRSWVVDASAFSGQVLETFPVGVSGDYKYLVYDIDNDGTHDYVEAMTLISGFFPSVYMGLNYVQNTGDNNATTSIGQNASARDCYYPTYRAFLPYSGYPAQLQTLTRVEETADTAKYDIFESTITGDSFVIWVEEVGLGSQRPSINVFQTTVTNGVLSKRVYSTSIAGLIYNDYTYLGAQMVASNKFSCYMMSDARVLERWDYVINLTGSQTGSITRTTITSGLPGPGGCAIIGNSIIGVYTAYSEFTRGKYHYMARVVTDGLGLTGYVYKLDITNGSYEERIVFNKQGSGTNNGQYTYDEPRPVLLPLGDDDVLFHCAYIEYEWGPMGSYNIILNRAKQSGFTGTPIDGFIYLYPYTRTGLDLAFDFSRPFAWNPTKASYIVTYSITNVGDYVRVTETPSNAFISTSDLIHQDSKFDSTDYAGLYNTGRDTEYGIAKRASDGLFVEIRTLDGDEGDLISPPSNYTLKSFCGSDGLNSDKFWVATNTVTGLDEVISVNDANSVTRRVSAPSSISDMTIIGSYWVAFTQASKARRIIHNYVRIPGIFPHFLLLQRDNYDFNIVKSGFYRERIEISNYAPIVTMDRRVASLQLYYMSTDGTVTTSTNPSISGYTMSGISASGQLFTLGVTSDDFRYTGVDGAVESGYATNLYVVFSGQLGKIDLDDLSAMSGIFTTTSGSLTRIETSNFASPDQYMFVSISGYTGNTGSGIAGSGWGFLEKDPSSGVWVDYSSGYPQQRTTIIRFDDVL